MVSDSPSTLMPSRPGHLKAFEYLYLLTQPVVGFIASGADVRSRARSRCGGLCNVISVIFKSTPTAIEKLPMEVSIFDHQVTSFISVYETQPACRRTSFDSKR